MNADAFIADLQRKPEVLDRLATTFTDNPWAGVVPAGFDRVVLLGMGSSAYAAGIAAARLRSRGVVATAELASSALLPRWGAGTLVVVISATGGSVETLEALDRMMNSQPGLTVVALTNMPDSPVAERCHAVIDLAAEKEAGGVACRSYQNTLALLLALELHMMQADTKPLVAQVQSTAAASAHLLDTESRWRPELAELLLGPDGTHLAAPAHRFSSAQQGALMLREGPRLGAVGCETGDWSHVDVYLTKTTDYRLLVFAGSVWEPQLSEWTTMRGSTVVGVGGDVPGAQLTLRYPGDEDDEVRLLTEVLVPELIAARAWRAQSQSDS